MARFEFPAHRFAAGMGNESVTTIDLLGGVTGAVIVTTRKKLRARFSKIGHLLPKTAKCPIIGIIKNKQARLPALPQPYRGLQERRG